MGTIAEEALPLNLSDAQKHPAFQYLPETGEEIYNSFLGVPILRAGRTLGVLVVQNTARRTYHEEEVEALQTTAMVLAEMIRRRRAREPQPSRHLDRSQAADLALRHRPRRGSRPRPRRAARAGAWWSPTSSGEDVEHESSRLDDAISSLRLFVDDMLSRDDIAETGEHRDVLEAYRMFAYDRGWVRRMHEAIRNGLSAEAAVEKVQSDMRARCSASRTRSCATGCTISTTLPTGCSASSWARTTGRPTVRCRRTRSSSRARWERRSSWTTGANASAAWCWEEGGPTSHVAIVARALGIASVGRAENVVSLVENGGRDHR